MHIALPTPTLGFRLTTATTRRAGLGISAGAELSGRLRNGRAVGYPLLVWYWFYLGLVCGARARRRRALASSPFFMEYHVAIDRASPETRAPGLHAKSSRSIFLAEATPT